jgi:2-methylcitrate dehydratase PrpD
MSTISETIANWVTNTSYKEISQDIIKFAKRSILDFLGVALAGSTQSEAQIIKGYLREVNGAGTSSVIGLGIRTSCIEAAFANGVIGHCLDYDDLLRPMPGAGAPHVTAVILPAVLAVGEKRNMGGRELITAYALGCEVTYRVGRGIEPAHYNAGWHSTGTEGIFGATVAAGKLLDLTSEEMTYALGIAGSSASGLHENFGTMTKPFHAGQAAANGVKASILASLGFTSSKTIFEGKSGYCNVLSKNSRLEEITRDVGTFISLPQVCIKFYPCCAGSHSAICSAIDLAKQYDIRVENIMGVEVKCDPQALEVVTYEQPTTVLQAKFSFHFPIALALIEKKVTLSEFNEEKIKNQQIVALMEKIKIIPTPELHQTDPLGRSQVVEVHLKDGRKIAKRCDYFPGTPRNPLSEHDLLEKYRSCARLVLSEKNLLNLL